MRRLRDEVEEYAGYEKAVDSRAILGTVAFAPIWAAPALPAPAATAMIVVAHASILSDCIDFG